MKVAAVAVALVLTALVLFSAAAIARGYLKLDHQTQFYIFAGLASGAVLLWIGLLVRWRRTCGTGQPTRIEQP
jgi:hypothetical protein